MLLDVFLGGFIVSIVLMSILGRPIADHASFGGGGEAFILVEFEWAPTRHTLSPVIKLNERTLNAMGFASPWQESISHWVEHDKSLGIVDNASVQLTPFDRIAVDGFNLGTANPITTEKGDRNYGYIWISKPCRGVWEFGIRPVRRDMAEEKEVQVWYRVHFGGFGFASVPPTPGKAGGGLVYADKEVFKPFELDSGGRYFNVDASELDDQLFSHCPK